MFPSLYWNNLLIVEICYSSAPVASMSASGNVNFFDAIHDTILMGVHQYKYKNGTFTDKIFRETPAIDAFKI